MQSDLPVDISAPRPPGPSSSNVFASFFLGGFECSTHRLKGGRRLDLVASTGHDRFAAKDYRLLQAHGIFTVREGLRWHLIEATPNQFDLTSAESLAGAASNTGTGLWVWECNCRFGGRLDKGALYLIQSHAVDRQRPGSYFLFKRLASGATVSARDIAAQTV